MEDDVIYEGMYSKLIFSKQNSSELDFSDAEHITLPPHRRCVCHTLNLVATTDVGKIKDEHLKKINFILRSNI